MKYDDKIVLIIGGSSGIGLATAKKYATERAKVIIVGKSIDKLQIATKEIGTNTEYYSADISSVSSIKNLHDK